MGETDGHLILQPLTIIASPTSKGGGPVRLGVYLIGGVRVPLRHALSGL